jgi:hypothetical protein
MGNLDPTGNSGCPVGTWYYNVIIVPDDIKWTGANSNEWNDDANWSGNQAGETGHHYVPIEGSNVVIPYSATGDYPVLTTLNKSPYPTHINYPLVPTCGNVYFESGAMMLNQHLLVHDRAFVDVEMPNLTWNSVAVPIEGVVTGDMYIPYADGESKESTNPFEVAGYAGSRLRTGAFPVFKAGIYGYGTEL